MKNKSILFLKMIYLIISCLYKTRIINTSSKIKTVSIKSKILSNLVQYGGRPISRENSKWMPWETEKNQILFIKLLNNKHNFNYILISDLYNFINERSLSGKGNLSLFLRYFLKKTSSFSAEWYKMNF